MYNDYNIPLFKCMVFITHNTNFNLTAVLYILSPSTTIQINLNKIFAVKMIAVSTAYTTVNIHKFSRTFNESKSFKKDELLGNILAN